MGTLDRVVAAMISTQSGYDCCALGFSDKKATDSFNGIQSWTLQHKRKKLCQRHDKVSSPRWIQLLTLIP
jgi:hypothetical protein